MRFSLRYIVSALVACGLLAAPALAAEKMRIFVKPEASVRDRVVRFQDIAILEGGGSGVADTLKRMVVAASPPLGQELVLSSKSLERRLKLRRPDLEGIEVEGPAVVRISRDAQEVSEAFVKQLLTRYMETHLPMRRGRISIRGFKLRGKRIIPNGKASYEIIPPRKLNFVGNVHFQVVVKVGGVEATKLSAKLEVEVMAPVVVAVRTLSRGYVVTPQDVVILEASLGKLTAEPYEEVARVVGKRLVKRVNRGKPLLQGDLVAPLVIKRGDLVTIIVERGLLRVTVPGVALDNGEKDKIIRVRNLRSRRIIFARIADASTVRVDI